LQVAAPMATQSGSPVQPAHVCAPVLQIGVVPRQAVRLVAVHCTQVSLPVLHAGVDPEQLVSLVHITHVFVVALQSGVDPVQAVALVAVHCTQAPLVVLHAGVDPVQFASAVQGPHPLAALQTGVVPVQLVIVPATHACAPLQVDAAVNVVPLHEAAAQSPPLLHSTHPADALQSGVAPEHAVVVPATHWCEPLHVAAAVNIVPLHEAAAQSVALLQPTQCPFPSQTVPPLSLHDWPTEAFIVVQPPPAHIAMMHAVPVAGQSTTGT